MRVGTIGEAVQKYSPIRPWRRDSPFPNRRIESRMQGWGTRGLAIIVQIAHPHPDLIQKRVPTYIAWPAVLVKDAAIRHCDQSRAARGFDVWIVGRARPIVGDQYFALGSKARIRRERGVETAYDYLYWRLFIGGTVVLAGQHENPAARQKQKGLDLAPAKSLWPRQDARTSERQVHFAGNRESHKRRTRPIVCTSQQCAAVRQTQPDPGVSNETDGPGSLAGTAERGIGLTQLVVARVSRSTWIFPSQNPAIVQGQRQTGQPPKLSKGNIDIANSGMDSMPGHAHQQGRERGSEPVHGGLASGGYARRNNGAPARHRA